MIADVTALIGIAAVVVAAAGLGWQVYSWSRQHATRIDVEHSWMFLASGANTSDNMAMVTVYNRSNHTVEIRAVGWVLNADLSASLPILTTLPGATLPGTIGARSQGASWIPADGLMATLRERGQPSGTKLRPYAIDGEGRRHLGKSFPSW
jgi:hypothetical protein